MRKQSKKGTKDKLDQPKVHKSVSIESATLLIGMLKVAYDPAALDRALKLALRSPDLIREWLRPLLEAHGLNVDLFMSGEPTTPASKAEVMEFIKPILKNAAELASYAQIADIYLFGKKKTPENLVYAFYFGTRLFFARERKPTKAESKRIWEITVKIASSSTIGAPHWKKLESRGRYGVRDWLDPIKEKARNKFQTFLNQKKRVEAKAESSFNSLISTFDDEEDTP